MKYSFYVDKRKNNLNNKELVVIPQHPIINDPEESILKLKLLNFKFLNNIYNISNDLVNNKFNIRRTTKTYTITGYTGELYLTDEGFFNDQNQLIVSEVIDVTTHKSTITYDNTSLTYYNTADITSDTGSYWQNILTNDAFVDTKMKLQDNYIYFIEITSENEAIFSFDCVFYKEDNLLQTAENVDIVLQKYNTLSGFWDNIDIQTITFDVLQIAIQEISVSFSTVDNSNSITPSPNDKYRITSNSATVSFPLYIIKLQADKQIPVFDNGTVNTPTENTITIPDGFYKTSTLKKTLNDLLISYKISISFNEYTNKIKFTNDNTTFTPTTDDLIDENYELDLVIPNIENLKENFGIITSYQQYLNIPFNSYFEGDTHVNLMNFSKIIIVTNLAFKNKTHNDILNNGNVYGRGIGDVLCWVNADIPPFTCINYDNYERVDYELQNNHINYINFRFYNEKSQELFLDNCLINFEIIKEKIIIQ
jgi:hypothetical protein